MMSVETHLDNVFTEAALQVEKQMKGKVYAYKYYSGFCMDKLAKQGTCIVDSRRYNKGLDCDVLTVTDCDTKETFSANQFAIQLIEQ